MRKLLLIRHANVVRDPAVSSHQWRLSAAGSVAASALAAQVAPHHPQILLSSDEPKAMRTAEILAEELSLPTATNAAFREQDRRGAPYFTDPAEFRAAIATLFARPDEVVYGRESATTARKRFTRGIKAAAAQRSGNLAIVTHGTVMTLFVTRYQPKVDPVVFWQSLQLPHLHVMPLPF
jgi:broad specificity phosphatase PhoE